MEKKSFLLYTDTLSVIEKLTDEQSGKLLKRILAFQKGDNSPSLDPMIEIVFFNFEQQFERDKEKFESVCERNRENGLKGGRPRKPNETQENPENPVGFLETQENPTKPKKADSDSDSDSDSENDKNNGTINSSKAETLALVETEEEKETFGNEEINGIIDFIKQKVESNGFIYRKGTRERERAKNILTGKEFGAVAEKSNMTREQFCEAIIAVSAKLNFWSGKINNAETLYKHYAQVYNAALSEKNNLSHKPSGIGYL